MRNLGALARGYRLGQEPFPRTYRAVVAAAIRIAWDSLVQERRSVAGEAERTINARLQQILNELWSSDDGTAIGFDRAEFESVQRGGEQVSGDGKQLEKRPDLTFRLRDPPVTGLAAELYGLFVECKIIDSDPPKAYYEQGMARFLTGQYAPGMQHGLMVAYVRNGATVPSSLTPFLKDPPQCNDVVSLPSLVRPRTTPPVYMSKHRRIVGGQSAPVSLDHVWL